MIPESFRRVDVGGSGWGWKRQRRVSGSCSGDYGSGGWNKWFPARPSMLEQRLPFKEESSSENSVIALAIAVAAIAASDHEVALSGAAANATAIGFAAWDD